MMDRIKQYFSCMPQVIALSIPIAVQNIFVTAVSSADTIMVGQLNQNALSAVSLANQLTFVYNLILLGVTLGTGLMAAQYHGSRDSETVRRILGYALRTAFLISVIFCVLSCGFAPQIMRVFTDDSALYPYGVSYLRIVGISYIFLGFSQIYESVMKATKDVRRSTLLNTCALLLNLFFNMIFIFGFLRMPAMGTSGAALGTVLARAIEMCGCIWLAASGRSLQIGRFYIFRHTKEFVRRFWKYTLPITLNGLSWGSAFAFYSVIFGHLGTEIVAANSIVTVARNFAMVGASGLASGAGIYLGNLLGQNQMEQVDRDAGPILWMSAVLGAVGGFAVLLCSPLFLSVAALDTTAQGYLYQMLWINAFYIIVKALNVMLNNGIFCCGGDTRFGLICDTIDMWCFSIPLGCICAFVLHLPPILVYIAISFDELAKLPFMLRHYRKKRWMTNITTH